MHSEGVHALKRRAFNRPAPKGHVVEKHTLRRPELERRVYVKKAGTEEASIQQAEAINIG